MARELEVNERTLSGSEAPSDARRMAEKYGLPYRDELGDDDVDPFFLEQLPISFVKTNSVLPLKKEDGMLGVALSGPASLFALDDMERLFSLPLSPVFVPEDKLLGLANRFYERLSGSANEVMEELHTESLDEIASQWHGPRDLLDLNDEAPIIKLLNSVLGQAVKDRASDIHIEPFEKKIDVRFRIDGVLYPVLTPPRVIQEALVSRVKIMAGLNIAEKRLPQDGRIRLLVAGKDIDVRVSIVPTAFGERVVMRLLDRKFGLVTLAGLGLDASRTAEVERVLSINSGIILVTGPTGSGKTTSLYAYINSINSDERNIITVEDPVEYQIQGIGQIQVAPKIDLTFATGLRSILRQDPDVIMVGEIRDMETAEMAVQASMTGHLVLSTLHTNDAPTAVTRLVDMGIEQFLVASSLVAVVSQRLVRVLCDACKEAYNPAEEEKALFGNGDVPETLYRPAGCQKCFKTGFYGQTGIFEFMAVDSGLRAIILKNPDAATLRGYLAEKGVKTLREDGLDKVREGITSLEEVVRVTHFD
ncbi:MAG: type II secretion system ATPase GspE [Thermodesulfobacteriota bacterium]